MDVNLEIKHYTIYYQLFKMLMPCLQICWFKFLYHLVKTINKTASIVTPCLELNANVSMLTVADRNVIT